MIFLKLKASSSDGKADGSELDSDVDGEVVKVTK